jgi:2-(1,2-epoxy-1,2-dihydrophenyl)acetyl-CoA isomerase
MTAKSQLLQSRQGGVLQLEMNNPERRNGLTVAMADELREAFDEGSKDATVQAILLGGAGGHFSSGADFSSAMADVDPTPEGRRKLAETSLGARFHPALRAIWNCPKPVVAGVVGAAVGFSLSMALACDVRVMAADAYLTTGFLKIGLFPDGAMLWQLDRLVGRSRTLEFVLDPTRRLSAPEALAWGLAAKVVPKGEIAAEALGWAGRLGNGPQLAIQATKRQLHEPPPSFEATLAAEMGPVGECLASDDVAEGLVAFFEKRPPKFGQAGGAP